MQRGFRRFLIKIMLQYLYELIVKHKQKVINQFLKKEEIKVCSSSF